MQKIETPPYDDTAPAARPEDMTQPMGPLVREDQAIVDAIHELPEGSYETRHDDSTIYLSKGGDSDGGSATVFTVGPNGKEESQAVAGFQYSDRGQENPQGVYVTKGLPGDSSKGIRASIDIDGNTVREGFDDNGVVDREQARAVKLEVAKRLEESRKHLGLKAVENASK